MEIVCPSGLTGVIRGMKGKEAQAFVDPQLVRTHGSMERLLSNCWLETSNPGPYTLADGKPNWLKTLIGDRFHALMEIRGATFGYDYGFDVRCESCEKQYGWELDLRQLPRKKLPPESFEKIQAGENRFGLHLSDGKTLAFKLGTGEEEIQIVKLKGGATSQKKLGPVDALWVQTIEIIDTDEGKPIPGGPFGFRRYLEDLDYAELQQVFETVQSHEGGVETKIETVCEFCGWQQWIDLPFQRTFFEPRRAKKTG